MSQSERNFFQSLLGKEPWLKIEVKKGQIYINDRSLDENSITDRPKYQFGSVKVPPNSYFVLSRYRRILTLCWEITETIVTIATIGALCLEKILLVRQPRDFGLSRAVGRFSKVGEVNEGEPRYFWALFEKFEMKTLSVEGEEFNFKD